MVTGGKYIAMKPEYEPFLFNPRTQHTCFVECIKEAAKIFNYESIKKDLTIPEIYKKAGRKEIVSIATSSINDFKKVLDPEDKYQINIYKFKAPVSTSATSPSERARNGDRLETKLNDGTKHPKVKGTRSVINILFHDNHFMLMKKPVAQVKAIIKHDGFFEPTDNIPEPILPLEQSMLQQVPLSKDDTSETDSKKLTYTQNRWLYDFETMCDKTVERTLTTKVKNPVTGVMENKTQQVSDHTCYAAGWGNQEDFYEWKFKAKEYHDKPKTKSRMKAGVQLAYGDDAMKVFIEFLKKLSEEEYRKQITHAKNNAVQNDWIIPEDYDEVINNMIQTRYGLGVEFTIPPNYAKFVSALEQVKKFHEHTFVAYNSGRFDHFLILKHELGKNAITNILNSNGILSMTLYGNLKFVDLIRHTNNVALSKLCKNFDIPKEFYKSSFPHMFVKSDTLDYVGVLPDKKYWPGKKIPKEVYDEYMVLSPDGSECMKKPWSLKEYCLHYLRFDVISLAICDMIYTRTMHSVTGLDAKNYLTIPGVSYECMKKHISKYDVRKIMNVKMDKWIRESITGGRCFIQKRQFKCQKYDTIMEAWPHATQEQRKKIVNSWCDDGLRDFDAVSLYPSAMALFMYPTGEGKWVFDFDRVIRDLSNPNYFNGLDALSPSEQARNGDGPGSKLSIIECDITYPDKDIVTPLIGVYEGERREFNCYDKKNLIITSVDLQQAIQHNKAQVTKIYKVFEWDTKEFIFRDIVNKMFKARKQAKKDGKKALSEVFKLLLNSGYGKFIQKLIETKTKICDDNELMEKSIINGTLKSFDILNDQKMILEVEEHIKDNDKQIRPSYLGAFILGYSKVIMNDCIDAYKGFDSFKDTFSYTDTDSMIISLKQMKSLTDKSNRFGESFVGKNLGQLHDDLGTDAVIINAYWIQPKLYCLEYLAYFEPDKDEEWDSEKHGYQIDTHMRSKGVNLGQCNLKIEDFKELLNHEKSKPLSQSQFKRVQGKADKTDDYSNFGIETRHSMKVIGGKWSGRNLVGDCWVAKGSTYSDTHSLPVYS
eukprot:Lithocolla_globosa_v1_NODE_288_length_4628_cov_36.273562.p1 type:complete len:1047 gc:universal NODE_288_length_4628_cov_36.273562:4330-1190(-)